jgi:hypothetical protein
VEIQNVNQWSHERGVAAFFVATVLAGPGIVFPLGKAIGFAQSHKNSNKVRDSLPAEGV